MGSREQERCLHRELECSLLLPPCAGPHQTEIRGRRPLQVRGGDKEERERSTQSLEMGRQRQADGSTQLPISVWAG